MNVECERKKRDNDKSKISPLSNMKDKFAINCRFSKFWEKIRSPVESLRHLCRMLNLNFGRSTLTEGINLRVVGISLKEITKEIGVKREDINKRTKS